MAIETEQERAARIAGLHRSIADGIRSGRHSVRDPRAYTTQLEDNLIRVTCELDSRIRAADEENARQHQLRAEVNARERGMLLRGTTSEFCSRSSARL
jgi:hypothetical protein